MSKCLLCFKQKNFSWCLTKSHKHLHLYTTNILGLFHFHSQWWHSFSYGEGWDFGEVAKNGRGVNASQFNLSGTGIGRYYVIFYSLLLSIRSTVIGKVSLRSALTIESEMHCLVDLRLVILFNKVLLLVYFWRCL